MINLDKKSYILSFSLLISLLSLSKLLYYGPSNIESYSEDIYTSIKFFHSLFGNGSVFWNGQMGLGAPAPNIPSLIYHPLFLFSSLLSIKTILFIFWIFHQTLASFFFIKICKSLNINNVFSIIACLLFVFSSPTINYSLHDDWATVWLAWTMLPCITYFLIQTLKYEKVLNWLVLTILIGFTICNSNPNYVIVYGLTLIIVVCYILYKTKNLAAIKRLFYVIVLSVLICSAHLYYTINETLLFILEQAPERPLVREYTILKILYYNLYPLDQYLLNSLLYEDLSNALSKFLASLTNPSSRVPFLGIIFLSISSFMSCLLFSKNNHYFANSIILKSFVVGFLASLILSLIPNEYYLNTLHSGTFRDPMIFFGLLISIFSIQKLFLSQRTSFKVFSYILLFIHIIQISIYVYFSLFASLDNSLSNHNIQSSELNFYEAPNETDEIYKWMIGNKQKYGDKIALSPKIQDNLNSESAVYGSNNLYSISDFDIFFGIQVLNARYKGISVDKIYPSVAQSKGVIYSNYDLFDNQSLLNLIGINWLLITRKELNANKVSKELIEIDKFLIENEEYTSDKNRELSTSYKEEWVLLHNPTAWPEIFLLNKEVIHEKIKTRSNCLHRSTFYNSAIKEFSSKKRLLCFDIDYINNFKPNKLSLFFESNKNNKYQINLEGLEENYVVATSFMYRSNWTVETNEGKELEVFPFLDSLVAFKNEKNTNMVILTYKPVIRIYLIFLSLTTLGIVILASLLTGYKMYYLKK